MSNEVKRFVATRQDGVDVECVDSDDYAALEVECERLRGVMMGAVTSHFAKGWSRAAKEKELDHYLSEGIRQLQAERDALSAELAALKAASGEEVERCRAGARDLQQMHATDRYEIERLRAELDAIRKQEPAAWVAKGNITELKRAKEPTWVPAWNKDRHGRVALYTSPPAAQDVSGLVEALKEIRALFPANIGRQAFVVNGCAPLRADDDDEFYSVKKVNRLVEGIVTRIDAALSGHAQKEGE